MTVSYQYDVASSASGGFIRLLFRWRGSVWKVVYREMLIFTLGYVALTILYQFVLSGFQQRIFERIVFFCSSFVDLIPLSFMLGFYVSFIAARWWSQFTAIPWPDKLMNIIAMYIPGFDEDSRVVRRTLMRYMNLSLVLVLRSISMAVKRRFPTKEHLIEAGFMTKTELEMFQSVPSTEFNTFWIPCTWFINVLRTARQECRITDSNGLKLIMEELNEFRSKCGLLWGYDWISIPLVYTQVVTMATYAYYVACMFGRQQVTFDGHGDKTHRYDYYIPIFTILQLMFYMGLLKVAEQLINPFGDDDEDFELNWIIDRHMKVSYLGVDTLNSEPPPLVKDTYYNELDVKIPYTEASKGYKKKTYRGSVAYMQVPMEQQGMVLPEMSEEEDDGETVSESMGPRRPSVYTLFHSRGKGGVSPAGSFTHLDNQSIASVDSSEWKSMPNLATAQNASGTLGYNQAAPFVVDMATAEDDEIVLQEVIIDRSAVQKPPTVKRSDSLQIPGSSSTRAKVKEPVSNILHSLSPKIAPKFSREKLKGMFRKRRLSSAFPFYKLKGVRFTKDTKHDDDETLNQSLLDVSYDEPVDVEITLSTPELTEMEKETGVHPYYYTQQALTSAKQLATGKAVVIRQQPTLTRSGSQDEKFKGHHSIRGYVARSNSLPNICESGDYSKLVKDPIITRSLKKMSEVMKREKARKAKTKKKSPPPDLQPTRPADSSDEMKDSESDDEESRRNTLPQITVTKCRRKASAHSDRTTSSPKSDHSCDRDSGVVTGSPVKRDSAELERNTIPHRPSERKHSCDRDSDAGTKSGKRDSTELERNTIPHRTPERKHSCDRDSDAGTRIPIKRDSAELERNTIPHRTPEQKIPSATTAPITQESAPESHSTTKRQQLQYAKVTAPEPTVEGKKLPRRGRSPPPKRPEKLSFSKYQPTTKKIAGIALKSEITPSPTSESVPTSPTTAIPTAPKVGRTPSFPKRPTTVSIHPTERGPSVSPKRSPTSELPKPSLHYPRVQADTAITISDPTDDPGGSADQTHPPEIPQRHVPRAAGRGKK